MLYMLVINPFVAAVDAMSLMTNSRAQVHTRVSLQLIQSRKNGAIIMSECENVECNNRILTQHNCTSIVFSVDRCSTANGQSQR
jgi:hypothetical protein